jgi:hypothetical protein
MARTYENFDVELIASGPTYEARFRSIAGEPRLTIPFPLEQHELDAFLSLFGKYQTRRLESPEFAQVRAVGQRLFDSLFTEQVRDALRVATRAAMQEGHGLRVRLDVSQARDLGMVPWEYMYFREYDDFVSLSNWTPVVRHLDVAEPLPPVHLEGALRILVMISDPIERRGTLDVEREWSQLQQALEGPVSRGEIELYRLPDGQLETLQVDLQRNSYHVFHFIGHGEYSEEHDDGVLVLEDSRGREVHVPGNTLGTYLRDSLDTRLVVLNNCEGAAFESDPFTGSAQSLLRKGIPAIVAMQFEITDRAAIDFARGFYTSVGNGFPVDAALAEARKVIRGGPTLIEFGSPVLYMSADDGILFIRAEEVEIPDDSKHTSLTPAGVKRVEEDLPAAEDVEPGGDLKETRGATVETAPGRLVELKDGGTDDTKGEEAAAATVEIAPDTETQPIGPEDEKAEPPDKRVWAIGGMAVAGILGLVIVINVLTDNDPPIETTQTTAVVTTVTVADTTVPAEASPFLPWTRVAEQDSLGGDGGQIMHDVLKVDDGWVAVGSETTSEGKHAAAWTSEDGLEWDRIGPEGFPTETSDGPEMRSVVQLSDQLVAAGVTSGDDTDAVVWTSVDGTEWRRVSSGSFGGEGNQAIRSLTVWEFGVVAVGWDNRGDSEGAVWTSADGIDWVRASDPDGALGGDGDQLMHDVAPGGPGLVAVGETQHPERDAEIWVSSDGDVWDRVDNTQAGLAEEGHQLANVIRAGPDILVVAGYDSGGGTGTDAAVWTSPDGETWQQVGDREELGGVNDQQIHGLTRVGNGWVAAGWTHPNPNDKDPAIWASEDADSWLRITDPDALARSGTQQVEAVAAAGSTIVAVGIDGEVETRDVAVWIGQPD